MDVVAAEQLVVQRRRKRSLRLVLTGGLALVMLVTAAAAGFFALHSYYQEKVTDTLTIVFLELERTALKVQQLASAQLAAAARSQRSDSPELPEALFAVSGDDLVAVRGPLHDTTVGGLGIDQLQDVEAAGAYFVGISGQTYLATVLDGAHAGKVVGADVSGSKYLALWRADVAGWMTDASTNKDGSQVYMLSRQGTVVYTNVPGVTNANYMSRPLVHQFVEAPLQLGQVRFRDLLGRDWVGFFYEVPRTNLVAFAETRRDRILAPVRQAFFRCLVVSLAGLGGALLMLHMILDTVNRPLRKLVATSVEISEGNFAVALPESGFLEIDALAAGFADMTRGLAARDARIAVLNEKERRSIRLEGEVELAKTLQLNLLPRIGLPLVSGLELGIIYRPATELAGDWYGYHFAPETGDTTIALADISGHGAAAAMFMTLIAGAFEELKRPGPQSMSGRDFITKVDLLFRTVGRGKWSATLLVATYHSDVGEIEVMNAGCQFPFFAGATGRGKVERLVLPSCIVGVDELQIATKRLKFPRDSFLVLYSDGLVEARDPNGRQLRPSRIKQAFRSASRDQGAQDLGDALEHVWQEHLGGGEVEDDVCILTLKAV